MTKWIVLGIFIKIAMKQRAPKPMSEFCGF